MTPSMAPGVLRLLPLLLAGRLVAADDDGGGENCTATLECCLYLNSTGEWEAVVRAGAACECAMLADSDGIIDYMKVHYCDLGCVPALSFIFCFVWVFFLFSLVASTADE